MTRTAAEMLIHVGYHKAASTVLQDQLFADPGGAFLPPPEPRHALVQRFVVPQPMCFNAAAATRHYTPLLDRAAEQGRVPVLSHERFSGYPPSGGFDSTIIADRLHRCFPQARILIVVREQRASILSMYSQYVSDGGDLSLRDYLSPREPFLKRMPGFSEEFYRYHRLVQRYRALFGADRVLCLPFEEFARSPGPTLQRIMGFVGREAPPPVTRTQNAKRAASFQLAQRQVNRWLSANELSPGRSVALGGFRRRFGALSGRLDPRWTAALDRRLERRMTALVRARFAGRFAQSNSILSELIGFDLPQYGYQTEDTVRD